MTTGLQLGAPGVYFMPVRLAADPQAVHLDETGFVGIAARGPVNTPVKITGWSDFVRWYGGLPRPERGEPPTLLAHAVQTYFAQGGRTAWVVRVGPPDSGGATAGFAAKGHDSFRLEAANEGSWGNLLSITLSFTVSAEFVVDAARADNDPTRFVVPYGVDILPHSLLRIGSGHAWANDVVNESVDGNPRKVCMLDRSLEVSPGDRIRVISGSLTVVDPDSAGGRTERFDRLGLRPKHPRFVTTVIDRASRAELWSLEQDRQETDTVETSTLVAAPQPWTEPILPDITLQPLVFQLLLDQQGHDRWKAIDGTSFYDDDPADADPLDEKAHRGVDAIGRVSDIGLLCVPDLAWRREAPVAPTPVARRKRSAEFVRSCAEQPPITAPTPGAPSPWLDAADATELEELVARQQRVVDVARLRDRFVALLDVPIELPVQEISRWRAHFGSNHAAAYHPWLGVGAGDPRSGTVFVPPSAFAAGIIASREIRLGIHRGPANELAVGAVVSSGPVNDALAADLIKLSVNVFQPERDGFRLQSARTLSTEPQLRQLSVRRLMTMLGLTLQRIGDRLVFEPGTPQMRSVLAQTLGAILGDFHRRGAFAGATESDSYFVRCDDRLNTPQTIALGQLIAEVGVAPAEPLEFIVVRIVQTAEGTEVSLGG